MNPIKILNKQQIHNRINRMAYEVYEAHFDESEVIIAGITRKGYTLAKMIQSAVNDVGSIQFKLAQLNFNKREPIASEPEINLPLDEMYQKSVILVDDVINTGQTLFYATKPFHQILLYQLKVLVLVNRDHTAFPFQPDYTGLSLATTLQERISVTLSNEEEAVYLT